MQPELLHDDADIRVVHRPGTSRFTLVTFGGAGARPAGLDVWAQKPVPDLGLDCVGLQAKAPNWYPDAAMRAAAPAIRARLQARSLGYGYSMGAYAALKYGALLGLTHALAVAPQATIDPAEVPADPRFHPHFDARLHPSMRITAADLPPFAVQALDPHLPEDALHAGMIAACGSVHLVALPFLGHAAMSLFNGTGLLSQALDRVLAEDPAGLRALLRRHRHHSTSWGRLMGITLYRNGHPRLAEGLWARVAALGENPVALARDRAVAMAERAAALRQRGRLGDDETARALCAQAIAAVPDDAPALLRVGATLTNQSEEALALPLLHRSLALSPGDAAAHLTLVHALLRLGQREAAREAIDRAALALPEDGAIAARRAALAAG